MGQPAPEPETLISACTALLSRRRFSTCSDFAHRLPPSHPAAERILAVVDVLSTEDLYSVLQLRFDADDGLVRQQFRKLALLLDPNTNTFPFSGEAFARLREAWHVLSDPERRERYDREIGVSIPRELGGTFWTACPYCWNLYEYEGRYEDCALLCHGCQKAFHGVAVKPPVKLESAAVEGEKRQSYWCHATVPLKYYDPSEVTEKEDKNLGEQKQNFVYISDDDDDGEVGFGGDEFGENGKIDVGNVVQGGGRVGGFQGNGQRRTRIKTVANKAVGRGSQVFIDDADGDDDDSDLDLDFEANDGELEFTEGDGDVFVGVRSSK